jgi:hypothetical protein
LYRLLAFWAKRLGWRSIDMAAIKCITDASVQRILRAENVPTLAASVGRSNRMEAPNPPFFKIKKIAD